MCFQETHTIANSSLFIIRRQSNFILKSNSPYKYKEHHTHALRRIITRTHTPSLFKNKRLRKAATTTHTDTFEPKQNICFDFNNFVFYINIKKQIVFNYILNWPTFFLNHFCLNTERCLFICFYLFYNIHSLSLWRASYKRI